VMLEILKVEYLLDKISPLGPNGNNIKIVQYKSRH
jgi:hypothetical protein